MNRAYCGAILVATLVLAATGPASASSQFAFGGPGAPSVITAVTDSVPDLMTIQAFVEQDGVPMQGDVSIAVGIFPSAIAPTALFSTGALDYIAENGVVTIDLMGVPQSIFYSGQPYLELIVEGEMLPRLPITTTPFSFRTACADSVVKQTTVSNAMKDGTPPGFPVTLTGVSPQEIAKQSIEAPTDGYCLVIATCEARWLHTINTTDAAVFGIAETSADLPMPGNQDVMLQFDANNPTSTGGGEARPVTIHKVFPCPCGTKEFFFNGHLVSGGSAMGMALEDVQLTLIFIPGGDPAFNPVAGLNPVEHSASVTTPTEGVSR